MVQREGGRLGLSGVGIGIGIGTRLGLGEEVGGSMGRLGAASWAVWEEEEEEGISLVFLGEGGASGAVVVREGMMMRRIGKERMRMMGKGARGGGDVGGVWKTMMRGSEGRRCV
jgi:hypothetical protein